jgi:3-mercaptopropionate dioxygenase
MMTATTCLRLSTLSGSASRSCLDHNHQREQAAMDSPVVVAARKRQLRRTSVVCPSTIKVTDQQDSVATLLSRLDIDTDHENVEVICDNVKATLIDSIGNGKLTLPESIIATSAESYARRLLHACDRYAIVVMVWAPGQGTPIHDHDDKWCVECVYQGNIQVTSYDLVGSSNDELVGFCKQHQICAGRGEAGSLIPPFDYHVIKNETQDLAVTIHVYGGEMDSCNIFTHVDGDRFRRDRKPLSYN